ncbi:hypothetical protein BCR43DRAFT_493019 [Syncephalastrum racemosum]|uniref:C2H2-type domain-containing protein n=1 Tax=Syncephalastrum racemosum TaxID=13706 RepID=A0A1X2H9Y4_SYNRA|nr:hypothetical protein BCR43DRAFT_493019 [Syncephalastrum racemosum]
MQSMEASPLSVTDASGRTISLLNNAQPSSPLTINSTPSPQSTDARRKYRCTEPGCNKSFTTSGHLARHNRIHTGEKNFPCLFPGCQSRFSRQDNMMQHYRTHMAPKSRRSHPSKRDDEQRPRPCLHAHHRIRSDPTVPTDQPLTIDQHLNNYYQQQQLQQEQTPVAVKHPTTEPYLKPSQHKDSFVPSFYRHRPLTFRTEDQQTAPTTLLAPSFPLPDTKKRTPSFSQQTQPKDREKDEDDSDDMDTDHETRHKQGSGGLLQLAHIVSTFG